MLDLRSSVAEAQPADHRHDYQHPHPIRRSPSASDKTRYQHGVGYEDQDTTHETCIFRRDRIDEISVWLWQKLQAALRVFCGGT